MAAVAAAPNFPATCLELGGKDPAYVRPDANLAFAAENIVDAGYFNSGQSCCAIERIYVHEAVYDRFVEAAVAVVNAYKLGSPTDEETTLGPMVRTKAADFVRGQVAKAVAQGREAADRREALRRGEGRARPISRRSSSPTSIIPWRS